MEFSDRIVPDFWREDFPQATNDGVSPFLFKGILQPTFDVSTEIAQVVRRLQSNADQGTALGRTRARVYVDEDRRDDIVAALLADVLPAGRSIVDYMKTITGADRFGLVINNLEHASETLSAYLGAFLHSMFSVRGVPIGGCEQVAFAGNYSGTAFGVHEGYEHAFLCHFGPGTKYFYCMTRETYLSLTGGSREPTFGDYSYMLEHADEFVMEPGDVLYLPALVYHVGRQTEFSVSVAVPLYTYPLERYVRSAILPALGASLPFEKEGMSPLLAPSADVRQAMAGVLSLAGAIMDDWRSRSVARILDYHWLRLLSNGGWEIDARFIEDPFLQAPETSGEASRVADGAVAFSLAAPYRIYWKRGLDCRDDEIRFFLRGQTLTHRSFDGVEALVERLNTYARLEKPGDPQASALLHDLLRTDGLTAIERI